MPQALCILRAFVDDKNSFSPFGHCRDQLDWVLVLRWGGVDCIDLNRRVCKSGICVSCNPIEENLLGQWRFCLSDDVTRRRIESNVERFWCIGSLHKRGGFDGRFQRLSSNQRYWLTAI